MSDKNMSAKNGHSNSAIKKKNKTCFRDSDKVIVLRNGEQCDVSAADVSVGDLVKTLTDDFQKIYYIYVPYDSDGAAEVILLSFKSNELSGVIGLTPTHLLYDGDANLRRAKHFKINDSIQTSAGKGIITQIAMEETKFVRSIVTLNGEVLLNGVRVSSYSGDPQFSKFLHKLSIPVRILANLNDNGLKVANYTCHLARRNIGDVYNADLWTDNDFTQIKAIMMKKAVYACGYFLFICLFVVCFMSFV
eukprot:889151_1